MSYQDDPDARAEAEQYGENRRETFNRLEEERAEQRWWDEHDKKKAELPPLLPPQESWKASYFWMRDQRDASLAEVARLKEENAIWRSEHDPCPFSIELAALRVSHARLLEALKSLLQWTVEEIEHFGANTSDDFIWDEVIAAIAAAEELRGK